MVGQARYFIGKRLEQRKDRDSFVWGQVGDEIGKATECVPLVVMNTERRAHEMNETVISWGAGQRKFLLEGTVNLSGVLWAKVSEGNVIPHG